MGMCKKCALPTVAKSETVGRKNTGPLGLGAIIEEIAKRDIALYSFLMLHYGLPAMTKHIDDELVDIERQLQKVALGEEANGDV